MCDPGRSARDILADADAAMYHAKTAGRDCYTISKPAPPVASRPQTLTAAG